MVEGVPGGTGWCLGAQREERTSGFESVAQASVRKGTTVDDGKTVRSSTQQQDKFRIASDDIAGGKALYKVVTMDDYLAVAQQAANEESSAANREENGADESDKSDESDNVLMLVTELGLVDK